MLLNQHSEALLPKYPSAVKETRPLTPPSVEVVNSIEVAEKLNELAKKLQEPVIQSGPPIAGIVLDRSLSSSYSSEASITIRRLERPVSTIKMEDQLK
jgi:hypothetical protein